MNMKHNPLRLPTNRDQLIARAIEADDGCVSVVGLAMSLGMLEQGTPRTEPAVPAAITGLLALSRFIQFARREHRLTPAEFATKLGLESQELLDIEAGIEPPELRVLHVLSIGLKVSYEKLQILAGYRVARDEALEREAIRFAASSGPMDKLSKSEAQALQAFIRALHD